MTTHDFITKTVPFRFAGTDLKFHLSQALFSSFEVDRGSQLLLKTLAQNWSPPDQGRVADLGCGVGVLGIALKKKWPQLEVEAVDRDALACEFTRMNGVLNQAPVEVRPQLGLESPRGTFDLIVSNLPAKAGGPVLTHFLRQMSRCLSPGGRIAVVIVTPLAEWLTTTVQDLGGTILLTEENPQYRVLHFTLPPLEVSLDLDPYLRTTAKIKRPGYFFSLDTVYGLPNFDNLDYEGELGLALLKKWEPDPGAILFWNPGQGHLCVGLGKKLKHHQVVLAGRDQLSLRIAGKNLSAVAPMNITLEPCPHWDALEGGGFHQVVVQWENTPLIKEEFSFWDTLNRLTLPGARVLILSTSHEIQELIKTKRGWPISDSPKNRGFRGLLVEKNQ